MDIRTRARVAWSVFRDGFPARYRVGQQKQTPFIWPLFREGNPQWNTTSFQSFVNEGFNRNSLIYSAIMYKARSKMSAPLRAYSGDPRSPEQLPQEHPLAQLVARPNPYQSGIEFQVLNEVYFNLGNCYIMLVRPTRGGLPTAMYTLRPDRVHIIPGEGGIMGYVYKPEGKSFEDGTPIVPEDMMHIKLVNPNDPLEGLGEGMPPLPIAQSTDVDNEITRFLKLFFESGTQLQGLLKFNTPLDDTDVAQVKARWAAMYGGTENWTEVAVLDQGGDYVRIGTTFDEMGFEAIDERNESRILGPLGVPPILIGTRTGLNRSTYSNYEEARRAYWEDTAIPEQTLFEVEYKYYLQSDDGGFVAFDRSKVPALQRDIPALISAAHQAWQMGVPADLAFAMTGVEVGPIPGGNISYIAADRIPSGVLPAEGEQDTAGAIEAESDTRATSPNGNVKAHTFDLVSMTCPLCGNGQVEQYHDHGGLCVCVQCGRTFDPTVTYANTS